MLAAYATTLSWVEKDGKEVRAIGQETFYEHETI
jgi:hypothetical protein